jgi:hypothetical protein
MAELRVQEKRRSLAWLWVLLLALLIGAGVWWWMTTQNREATPVVRPSSTNSSGAAGLGTVASTLVATGSASSYALA